MKTIEVAEQVLMFTPVLQIEGHIIKETTSEYKPRTWCGLELETEDAEQAPGSQVDCQGCLKTYLETACEKMDDDLEWG